MDRLNFFGIFSAYSNMFKQNQKKYNYTSKYNHCVIIMNAFIYIIKKYNIKCAVFIMETKLIDAKSNIFFIEEFKYLNIYLIIC